MVKCVIDCLSQQSGTGHSLHISSQFITLPRVLPLRSRVVLGLDTQPTTCMPRGLFDRWP